MYSDNVMDHFLNPRNAGKMEQADGVGKAGDSGYGNFIEIYIRVKENVITEAMFQAFGCTVTIAASSMVTELIKNKTVDDALAISNKVFEAALGGLPPEKMNCLFLTKEALFAAIEDYRRRSDTIPKANG